MATFVRICLVFAASLFQTASSGHANETDSPRPNVLIILADDLGFSDPGCYGGEIETPNIDALAASGIRFTDFYNTARCWPTRSAIMSGFYPQQIRRDSIPGLTRGGHGGVRPEWAILLPEMLKQAGYRTFHSGKWHIDGSPLAGGFDRSYRLADHGRFFSPERHFLDDQRLPVVQRDSGYYSTTRIADEAIGMLTTHQQAQADSPFFCFVAFTAPHFPLHALPEDIAKYKGRYDAGWQTIRTARWDRIQNGWGDEPGFLKGQLSDVEPDVGPPYHLPEQLEQLGPHEVNRPVPWDSLSVEQQRFQANKMEIHAAMVDRMDQEIGRILDQIPENTLVMFLSDNGASAEIMVRDDGHDRDASPGSAGSHLCLGPGWSTVCNTPFRYHKTWVHEGGCATPLIVRWPENTDLRNRWCHHPGHVVDVVPTILELCCGERDTKHADAPDFPGVSFARQIVDPGSLKTPELETLPSGERVIWFAHEGHRAIRRGDWKLVANNGQSAELFNLAEDRTETADLSATRPELITELEALWLGKANEFSPDPEK